MSVKTKNKSKNGANDQEDAPEAVGRLLDIPAFRLEVVRLRVVGMSPLLVHAFSAKARRDILERDRRTSNKAARREPRGSAESEVWPALYHVETYPAEQEYPGDDEVRRILGSHEAFEGRFGFPSRAIKNSVVDSARITEYPMTLIKQSIFVYSVAREGRQHEDLMILDAEEIRIREDFARINGRTATVRFRPEFHDWSTEIEVKWPAYTMAIEQVIAMLNLAGETVGLGDWRPEKLGVHGRFRVEGM